MISVVQETAVQKSIEENKRTSITNSLSSVNPTSKISDPEYSCKQSTICRYIASKQSCPYGSRCRYRHPPKPKNRVKPVCRHYLQGECRYGNHCKFLHPKVLNEAPRDERSPSPEQDRSIFLNVNDYPSISQSKDSNYTIKSQSHTRDTSNYSIPLEQKRLLHHQDGTRTVPVELQLEAFFKRAATITPRPSVPHPSKKVQAKPFSQIIEDKVTQIERVEVKLLQEEHTTDKKEPHERDIHVLRFQPSDPKWDQYSTQPLQLIVTFPELYPEQPLNLKVIDENTLPKSIVLAINTKLDKQIAILHQESIVPSGHTPLFKTLLKWLDDNIIAISDKNHEICVSSESDSESEYSTDSDGSEQWEEPEDNMAADSLRPIKRGTEIRIIELNMNKHVATVLLNRLKLTVQCTRCKNKEDVVCTPEKQSSLSCDKCQSCFAVTLHPDIIHPTNTSLCFMDIIGCKPVDVVLPFCDFTITCLECQKESIVKGISYGESFQTSCRSCHTHLQIFIENCKFIAHQSGPLDAMADQMVTVKKKKKRSKDSFVIQEGHPLPEMGTCLHYKKSHRWLRFPCCGKAYPCDVCHDLSEDHPMERANRMICGYCSKEQGYTGNKPCILCGSDVAYVKTSAYWEGGLGCRNKKKMKKNDPHKYKHDNKVISKKDERVGIKGKKNRDNKNNPSV